jgi:hypothetical protein
MDVLTNIAFEPLPEREVALGILQLLFLSSPVICWIVVDYYRGFLATPERIEFDKGNNDIVVIQGSLPSSKPHEIGGFFIIGGVFIFLYGLGDWAIKEAPLLGDLLLYTMGVSLLAVIIFVLRDYLSKEKILEIDHSEIASGIMHMSLAANALKIDSPEFAPYEVEAKSEIRSEFREIHGRLESHDRILSSIISATDILKAPSASMGVIAIRTSTEQLMAKACKNAGITWKPNARNTLDSYIKKFNVENPIDSRIQSYLTDIQSQGNRAAHHFNLNWGEFMITSHRFCEVVQWYSDTFTAIGDESE